MKLDLHGVKHQDVRSLLDSHIFNYDPPFEVVTGNSLKMRELVLEVLEEYGLSYFDTNLGCIMVIEEPNKR